MFNSHSSLCFCQPEYKVSYDLSFLQNFIFTNTRIIFRYFLCGPPQSVDEGLYFRTIYGPEEVCIQCIFFYKRQWLPYHLHDYHPFYLYLDYKRRLKFLVIDDGHHFSKLLFPSEQTKPLNITIFLPDHGLTDQIQTFGKPFHPRLIPLTPSRIQTFWLINNMAQLKLRTKLVDPWAKGLIPQNPAQTKSLIYRLNYILPLKSDSPLKANLRYTFRDEAFCPYCKCLETLDFMPLYFDKKTQKFFLQKQAICKNKHQYLIRYNFEKGTLNTFPL
ncbi:MAG: hypothetical protein ACTSRS_16005 [Candidatus Helarchaeota archaeon]